jgi:hypothetical protein
MKNQSYLLPDELIEKMNIVRELTGNSRSQQIRSILNAFFSGYDEMMIHLRKEYRVKELNGCDFSEDGIIERPNTLLSIINEAND